MKKLLLLALVTFASVAAYGQGALILNNGSTNRLVQSDGNFPPVGTWLGLYLVNPGTAPGAGGTLAVVTNINLAPGLFNDGNIQVPGAPSGNTITVQIRAWTGSASSYETATDKRGSSITFSVGPLSAYPAPGPATANAGWPAFVLSPVPEPSAIALGLLGLGAVVLFRRRK